MQSFGIRLRHRTLQLQLRHAELRKKTAEKSKSIALLVSDLQEHSLAQWSGSQSTATTQSSRTSTRTSRQEAFRLQAFYVGVILRIPDRGLLSTLRLEWIVNPRFTSAAWWPPASLGSLAAGLAGMAHPAMDAPQRGGALAHARHTWRLRFRPPPPVLPPPPLPPCFEGMVPLNQGFTIHSSRKVESSPLSVVRSMTPS